MLSIMSLALKFWFSNFPNNAYYNVPSRYWEPYFSVTRGWVSSILVFAENWELVEIYWQIKLLNFSLHMNLQKWKVPKYAFTFDLSRHAKSSLIETTGFISSNKVAIKPFPLSASISGNNYFFDSLRFTSNGPIVSRNVLQSGVFSFFKAIHPHNYYFDIFLQYFNLMLATWVWKSIRKTLHLYPSVESWWSRVARECF